MGKIKNKIILFPIIVALISIIAMISINLYTNKNTYISYNNFLKDIDNKKISKVYITDTSKIEVKLKNGQIYQTDNPRSLNFKENLLKQGINISENSPMTLKELIPVLTLIASLISIVFIALKNTKFKSKSFASIDALESEEVKSTGYNFESIAGNEEAKESVRDIVDFLKNPEKYNSYGARMPKGIILYGEPGTGKTLLAKAVASEAKVPFYAVSGSDFIQVYVGVGASRIRQLFKKAKNNGGKAVIFIDEIDAIGKKRSSQKMGGSEERDQTLNALLTEMSGFNESDGIVVIAATNRLDVLDEALLRPGRFDRHIEINLPDIHAREKILKLHLKNKPIGNIDVTDWAKKTAYFSGAKIESLTNEAAILACKENSPKIEDIHVDKAFSIILAGYEKQNRDYIKNKDKKITAYHEIGHALITKEVLPNEKISKVTIIPSTKGAGGYTLSIPEDSLYQSKDYLLKRIMVLLGGRAAEEIIFGKNQITTGAHNDLQRSTSIAYTMITQYGMGETLGLLNLAELSNKLNIDENNILNECKNLIDSIYNEVKQILLENKHVLDKLAKKLIEKETLYTEDFC
ncbi:ATP-dependent zinc metalloprotease FtsH [Clostridium niameyense]|uniref:ATP-dependent zinc metalloprotease FtsH n=1 Tax=Clostridium niameyense TaxID=1622073 RepID=A0A6M0RAB6_9CLOT|nr:FtsH/Yme1/Tma family ATP-dependent metallopeptidase [Clostridium niameyense]NEZ47204.1 ATP-dependent zinc metalloprotease FtsH [Clostridium niameyense]